MVSILKNKSELVYDVGGRGNYINMAITCMGISDEQLLKNVSSQIGENIVDDTYGSPWPPYISELEDEEQFSELLAKEHLLRVRQLANIR